MASGDPIVLGQSRKRSRKVFYAGTDALYRGRGLCYVRNYGTAANIDESRDQRVAQPSATNNQWFAGVLAQDYAANAAGQWVEIYEPGSICLVSILESATLGDVFGCCVGTAAKGRFIRSGVAHTGRGTVRALQTRAADSTSASGVAATSEDVISSSLDGSAVAATVTVTKTSLFTRAAPNDKVVVVAGATTATMATAATVGEYTISTWTSANVAVVNSSIGATPSIAAYVVRGNPCILAELLDGEESGCVEWLTPISATAVTAMTFGRTLVFGGATITTDATDTLADGTAVGQLKSFKLMGTLTTNDYLLTVTTGIQLDGTTTLASLEFDGANDETTLIWGGPYWRPLVNKGTAQA